MNSLQSPPDDTATGTIEDRIKELEEIEDELRIIADSDADYAEYAQNFLDSLEEVRD